MSSAIGKLRTRWQNHWAELDESQRSARKLALLLLGLAVVALPGWYFGRPVWTRWQRGRALAQVQVFARSGDYRSATLALRRAVALGPNDPSAWREAVRLLGEIGSPEVLTAREQVVRLEPGDRQAQLALVEDALRFDRLDLAKDALAALDEPARREASFYRMAAALAQALGRDDEIAARLEELVQADAGDATARFNLAAVRLWSEDAGQRAAARETLLGLTQDPRVRVRAALELLKEAARQNRDRAMRDTLASLQEKMVPGWRNDFPDTEAAGWTRLTERLKTVAGEDGPDASAVLARWQAEIGQPREALIWLETLPDKVRSGPAVADAEAELSARVGDLDRLERYLADGAWGSWPREVLTLAMASRLQRQRYSETTGRATWDDAVRAAGDSLPALRTLTRLARTWNDTDGEERVLETMVKRYPSVTWAFEALKNIYASRSDLPRLWQLHGTWVRQRPNDRDVALRWIALGCILDHVTPELVERAEALPVETDRLPAATIALAAVRWRQHRPQDTVALISGLPADAKAQPAAALWLGLAGADLKDRAQAVPALQTAWAAGLSREERELVRSSARKLNLSLSGGSL